jgi:3-deoxy-manno-octulosonate cytidylyltransferase (CMP-KDO synthetase)
MTDYIVIPARFASKRLPGKPLVLINGIPLLNRVISVAKQVVKTIDDVSIVVATDNQTIIDHCLSIGVDVVFTCPDITSGSERALVACRQLNVKPRYILNLQGDAPFISPEQVIAVLNKARHSFAGVVTPVVQLTWTMLDGLREQKLNTPFSGTTCVFDKAGKVFWFSKNIIPRLRSEEKLRMESVYSPVFQHLGLYCYSYEMLEWFLATEVGYYESLEELEQLRFIENGKEVLTEQVRPSKIFMSGIDSLNDVILADNKIKEFGDPYISW